jgi:hypothetical protein
MLGAPSWGEGVWLEPPEVPPRPPLGRPGPPRCAPLLRVGLLMYVRVTTASLDAGGFAVAGEVSSGSPRLRFGSAVDSGLTFVSGL